MVRRHAAQARAAFKVFPMDCVAGHATGRCLRAAPHQGLRPPKLWETCAPRAGFFPKRTPPRSGLGSAPRVPKISIDLRSVAQKMLETQPNARQRFPSAASGLAPPALYLTQDTDDPSCATRARLLRLHNPRINPKPSFAGPARPELPAVILETTTNDIC